MAEEWIHPGTGEVLRSQEDFLEVMRRVESDLAPLYVERRTLREEYASRFEPPDQPAPRYRTSTQERVARCPRCGGRLESEEPPE